VAGFVPTRAQQLPDILNSAVSLLVVRRKTTDLRESSPQEGDATSMALDTSQIVETFASGSADRLEVSGRAPQPNDLHAEVIIGGASPLAPTI
jgi:hypothetical protein